MSSSLYLVNLPHNCTDTEVQQWIETSGFKTCSIRIIRDVIAGVSPAFAYAHLEDDAQIEEACFALTGKKMRSSQILVSCADEPGLGQAPRMAADGEINRVPS
jgi:RNA recognition motif-containing protein